jgi:hypothetical protein
VPELRWGREGDAGEERILGSKEFVEQVRQEVEGRQVQGKGTPRVLSLERVIERVCVRRWESAQRSSEGVDDRAIALKV